MTIDRLLGLMAALRDPEFGCDWDCAQTFASIAPYTIEEAYEVADAIERNDLSDLRDELGDLLLQVVFHARMAEEAGAFRFEDVVAAICAKLIRRHPHVFDAAGSVLGENRPVVDRAQIDATWERIKAQERAAKSRETGDGPLGKVTLSLPALVRAEKISRKAVQFGFDWPDAVEVVAKVREEVAEVEASLDDGDAIAVEEEIGDLLFSVVNLARHAGVDAEAALRKGTRKFERRFTAMAEELKQQGGALGTSDLAAMEAAWQAVKRAEKR